MDCFCRQTETTFLTSYVCPFFVSKSVPKSFISSDTCSTSSTSATCGHRAASSNHFALWPPPSSTRQIFSVNAELHVFLLLFFCRRAQENEARKRRKKTTYLGRRRFRVALLVSLASVWPVVSCSASKTTEQLPSFLFGVFLAPRGPRCCDICLLYTSPSPRDS